MKEMINQSLWSPGKGQDQKKKRSWRLGTNDAEENTVEPCSKELALQWMRVHSPFNMFLFDFLRILLLAVTEFYLLDMR